MKTTKARAELDFRYFRLFMIQKKEKKCIKLQRMYSGIWTRKKTRLVPSLDVSRDIDLLLVSSKKKTKKNKKKRQD